MSHLRLGNAFDSRILLQFDLSQIAPGSTINLASTALVIKYIGASHFGDISVVLYGMTYHDWTEDATRWFADGVATPWPGSRYDPPIPTDYASRDYNPNPAVQVNSNINNEFLGDIVIPVSGAFLQELISEAINLNSGKLSLIIMDFAESGTFWRRWASKENGSIAAPTLTVDWSPPSYALTLTEGAGGSCTASPDQLAYQEGAVVTLTVTPDEGYALSGWSGADAGDVVGPAGDGTYSITMDAAKTIQCDFVITTYKLTLNEGANGTDALIPNGVAPLHTYDVDEEFLINVTPDAGFQLDEITTVSGDGPLLLARSGPPSGDYIWTSAPQLLTQASEWTTVYKALWTLTTNIVGGANGTVTNGHANYTWPQAPLFAYPWAHVIQIVPNVGYTAQIAISAGSIESVEGTNLGASGLFDATTYRFTPPDADATLTVTWVAIPAAAAGGGLWKKNWNDDRGRLIL